MRWWAPRRRRRRRRRLAGLAGRPAPVTNGDHELDALLWDAREQIAMWGDVVAHRFGRRDPSVDRVRDRIDDFRARRGWSPDGPGAN
jgi:hypothetical protein